MSTVSWGFLALVLGFAAGTLWPDTIVGALNAACSVSAFSLR